MKRRALWPHGNSIFPLTTYVARKNKVDASKKVEQAKAEKLNQSQGVEISAIVVLSFHFWFRLQQCGFHYLKGYKASDSFWFRFCWAYERRFMTMLTTPIFVALLRLRLRLSLWLRLRLRFSLLLRLHLLLRFRLQLRLRLQLLLRFRFRLQLGFRLRLRLRLPLPVLLRLRLRLYVFDSHPVSNSDRGSTPWLVRAAKMLESESLCDSCGPDRKDWWANLRKSLAKRGFVQRHISGH